MSFRNVKRFEPGKFTEPEIIFSISQPSALVQAYQVANRFWWQTGLETEFANARGLSAANRGRLSHCGLRDVALTDGLGGGAPLSAGLGIVSAASGFSSPGKAIFLDCSWSL